MYLHFVSWFEHRLARCGKLVIARSVSDLPSLELLLKRAAANGVELHSVTVAQAKQIEPRVKMWGSTALWSPTTKSANPGMQMQMLFLDYLLHFR